MWRCAACADSTRQRRAHFASPGGGRASRTLTQLDRHASRGAHDAHREVSRARCGRRDRSRPRTGRRRGQARSRWRDTLRHWRRRRNGLAALLSRPQPAPKGLYMFGPVGRGKTMLMDLFFETTTFRHKRRVHFHEFMAEVHDRIGAARKTAPGDPIPQVAAAIADKTALLCFDELHVTDIADAMILGRLFKGAVREPGGGGGDLQRAPRASSTGTGSTASCSCPSSISSSSTWRSRSCWRPRTSASRSWSASRSTSRRPTRTPGRRWTSCGRELTGNHPGAPLDARGQGPQAGGAAGRRWAWHASPSPSCASSRWERSTTWRSPTSSTRVLIDGIPVLAPAQRDVARRFVNLIDTLYDNRVCLIASAAAEPHALYPAGDVQFLFERTASRLIEMRSEAYLTSPERPAERSCAGIRRSANGALLGSLSRQPWLSPGPVAASEAFMRAHGPEAADEPLQQAAVVVVVHLEPMTVGRHEGAGPSAGCARRQIVRGAAWRVRARAGLGDDQVGDQLALVVGKPPHAAVGLQQSPAANRPSCSGCTTLRRRRGRPSGANTRLSSMKGMTGW